MEQSVQSHNTAPLRRHRLFRSGELDEAREFVARKFCRHRLERQRSSDRFDACHHHAAGIGMSVNYIRYGAEVEIEPGELGSFYLIQIPIRGQAWIRNGRHDVSASLSSPSILNPDRHTTMRWYAGCEKLLLQIDRENLQSVAERLVGRRLPGSVVFNPKIDFGRPAMRRWWHRVQTVVQATEDGRLFSDEEGLSQQLVEEELIEAFFVNQPSNVSHYLEAEPSGLSPAYVKRAQRYIHENLASPMTIGKIAAATGTTPRSLQLGFRKACGMTPLQYVRCERLFAAHYELMRADPATSVAQIAFNWGFTHLGRFSRDYRAAFGISPREQLTNR